jgi:ribonuclease HII
VSNLDALRRALQAVVSAGSLNLVDGYALTSDAVPHEWLTRGDGTSAAIAAASVVAKETRDQLMRQIDAEHPGYGFADHKGYLNPGHLDAIRRMGRLSPVHRKSFYSKAINALDLAA